MKCLIVTGGNAPGKKFLQKKTEETELLIAVDGAADLFVKFNIVPDILTGDFDTVDPRNVELLKERGARVIRLEQEKNETDTEAAINIALAEGADDITITGALGGRIDHSLSNIMMLVKAESSGARTRIIDGNTEIFVSDKHVSFYGYPGQTVSILPLTGEVTVSSTGLKYELHALKLNFGSSRGISNIITGEKASLKITGGYALIIKTR